MKHASRLDLAAGSGKLPAKHTEQGDPVAVRPRSAVSLVTALFIFVTGVAGSGKSTLTARLRETGFEAHDADDGISAHFRLRDGARVTAPRSAQDAAWVAAHEYRFDMAQVRELASAAGGEHLFLLGSAYGDDEVIALADRSFYLHVEEAELRSRLARRAPGGYGQAPHELESILAWHAGAAGRYEALGLQRLDAERPVDAVADELLARAGT